MRGAFLAAVAVEVGLRVVPTSLVVGAGVAVAVLVALFFAVRRRFS